MKRRILVAILAAQVFPAFHTGAIAQHQWKTDRIEMVVPYPAGGSTDTIARAFADALRTQLNTTIVVQNRSGATGTIGSGFVARAKPDGGTILFTPSSPLTITPYFVNLPFKPLEDLRPVASVAISPGVLVAKRDAPFDDFAGLVAHAKRQPGAISIGFPGVGSVGHIGVAQIEQAAGIRLNQVPYQGSNQAVTDAIGGNIDLLVLNTDAVLQQIANGTIKPIGVTSPARLQALPNVPTFEEMGFKGVQFFSTYGIFAPAKMSADAVAELTRAAQAAVKDKTFVGLLQQFQALPGGQDHATFVASLKDENRRIGETIKSSKLVKP
ncbi:Bug family tripartite tricarboxylate transporter substrate binding protein [Pseudorhodoferax soli]|uniref:Tripartite-type tricarboxylate transporter receptor subunit TctC n=1 Tax=Pseudorhodoferax soli TaxID=545864 RepID=A0A368XKY1_9BURK|nr:tripartite tricarboxylate transporter substrate binding protein [Pseudorhodoferax soli]RCW68681.1 tripartite-type tricarboxylate transporter receptor subunit TctC [Pseudorhodoferax soli]